ncbi:MAG: hypothetical protein K2W82_10135 [Candidatus Obscuribacterales bacterium]|nr:hypothetical protein [Candidatus Obscuribacterales bacterium]
MEFRKAIGDDYAKIVELQNRNLASVLSSEAAKADGFLSGSFNAEQFAAMNSDLAVVVCLEQERLLGFLCASTIEFSKEYAIPAAMIKRYESCLYAGIALSEYNSCVCGPVCIEKSQRGLGLLAKLYQSLFELLPEKYNLAAVLIALNNHRSLVAHQKLGFETVDRFPFNQAEFHTLVKAL